MPAWQARLDAAWVRRAPLQVDDPRLELRGVVGEGVVLLPLGDGLFELRHVGKLKGLRVIGYQNAERFLKTLSLVTAP